MATRKSSPNFSQPKGSRRTELQRGLTPEQFRQMTADYRTFINKWGDFIGEFIHPMELGLTLATLEKIEARLPQRAMGGSPKLWSTRDLGFLWAKVTAMAQIKTNGDIGKACQLVADVGFPVAAIDKRSIPWRETEVLISNAKTIRRRYNEANRHITASPELHAHFLQNVDLFISHWTKRRRKHRRKSPS